MTRAAIAGNPGDVLESKGRAPRGEGSGPAATFFLRMRPASSRSRAARIVCKLSWSPRGVWTFEVAAAVESRPTTTPRLEGFGLGGGVFLAMPKSILNHFVVLGMAVFAWDGMRFVQTALGPPSDSAPICHQQLVSLSLLRQSSV